MILNSIGAAFGNKDAQIDSVLSKVLGKDVIEDITLQEALTKAVEKNTTAVLENATVKATSTNTVKLLNAEQAEELLGKELLNDENLKVALSEAGITIEKGKDVIATKALNLAQIDSILKSKGVQAETRKEILQKMALKSANEKATISAFSLNKILDAIKMHPYIAAITAVIGAIAIMAKVYDKTNVSVKEHEEKINDLKDSICSLRDEYNELKKIDSDEITSSEKQRLNYLERRIALEEELLKIEKQNKAEIELEDNPNYDTVFDEDSLYNIKNSIDTWHGKHNNSSNLTGIAEINLNQYQRLIDKIDELSAKNEDLKNKIGATDQSIVDEIEDITNQQAKLQDSYKDNYDKLAEKQLYLLNLYQKYNELANDEDLESGQRKKAKETADYFSGIYDIVSNIVYKYEKIFGTNDKNIEKLINKYSSITVGELQRNFSDEEIALLVGLDFPSNATISDFVKALKTKVEDESNKQEPLKVNIDIQIDPVSFSELTEKINSIQGLYSKLQDNISSGEALALDINDVEDLRDKINIATESFNAYEKVLTSSGATEQERIDALNQMATECIYASGELDKLTASNRDQMVTQFELNGLTNAGTIITKELAEAFDYARENGIDLSKATYEDIIALTNLESSTDDTNKALWNYYINKRLVNDSTILTAADINNLIKEAEQLGINCDKLREYRALKSNQGTFGLGSGNYTPAGWDGSNKGAGDDTNENNDDFKFGNGNNTTSGSGGSGSDAWLEEYKKKLAELQDQLDKELITERQFYDGSEALMNQYLKDSPAHIAKYEEEISDAEKTLHSDWVNAYGADLDTLKEKYEEEEISAEEYLRKMQELYNTYYVNEGTRSPYGLFTKEVKEALDNYKSEVESVYSDIQSKLKQMIDDGAITEKEYLREMETLWQRYYKNNVYMAKESADKRKELLREEKDYMTNVANAFITLLQHEIDGLENERDDKIDKYQEKIDSLQEDIDKYQDQIDDLDDQIDVYQDQIDALEKANEERQRALDLQQAQYDLERAMNQKTNAVLTKDGIKYENDSSAVKDAQEALDNAKLEEQKAAIQAQIDLIEDQKDALQDQIDILNEEIDRYNDLIDETNKYFDNQIQRLEEQKNKWEEVTEYAEIANARAIVMAYTGSDDINKILGTNLSYLDGFKNHYSLICKELGGETSNFAKSIADLAGVDFNKLSIGADNTEDSASRILSAYDQLKDGTNILNEGIGTAYDQIADNTNTLNDNMNAAILGGGGSSSESSSSSGSGSGDDSGSNAEDGSGSIIGTITNANDLMQQILNGEDSSWLSSWKMFGNSTNEIFANLVENAVSMANNIIDACNDAIKAINELSKAQESGTGNDHMPHVSNGYSGKAFAKGTNGVLNKAIDDALVGEVKPEIVANTKDGTYKYYEDPAMVDLKPGDMVFNGDDTKELINNKNNGKEGTVLSNGTKLLPYNGVLSGALKQSGMSLYNVDNGNNKILKDMIDSMKHVNNNTNNTTQINQEINVTLPNVTDSTKATELLKDLKNLSLKATQKFTK